MFGLIVGHNEKSQGAVNYLGQSEFEFNSIVAKMCQQELKNRKINSEVIFRNRKSYSEQVDGVIQDCQRLSIRHTIELHFNSAAGNPLGCEALVALSDDERDNRFAELITDLLNVRLGIKERGDNGVKTINKSARGAGMLYGLKKNGISCIIIEPCFSNKSIESEKIFTNPDYYSILLAEAIEKTYYANKKQEKKIDYRIEAEELLQKIRQMTYEFHLKWND